jgi:catechol 2,3-dioxygenase
MGVTTKDIFGAAFDAQPAAEGTYGERPAGWRLPDATRLGRVQLQVADLERSLAFYHDVLGLRVATQSDSSAALTASGDERILVELIERKGVRAAAGGRLGLYHFAILLPDRGSLGRFVRHLSDLRVPVGSADHLVSEALYLHDPDGLGIEVYADRPRDAWQRRGRELMIATDPLDTRGLLAAAGAEPWAGMPAGTVIGHVHLHVGDLQKGAAFFSEGLGFDRITWSYPGALFLGAGGYHHHLGTNTWAGPSARPASEDEARLLEWTIELPDRDSLLSVRVNLAAAGHQVDDGSAREVVTRDPWGTTVRLSVSNDPRGQR